MHPKNPHIAAYPLQKLIKSHSELAPFVRKSDFAVETVDFADPIAVFHLNKAILKHYYGIEDWNLPPLYLCPPIPGRLDYLLHLSDFLSENGITDAIKGLDIGVGANAIYPILGAKALHWNMVGCDIDPKAVESAKANIMASEELADKIEIRHQSNNANLFEGIIQPNEHFSFSMCNPPFHPSEEAALRSTNRKWKNLKQHGKNRNFGGQSNELWCNGGEALFLKRMIKQSASFKQQVNWFTSLISKKENLNKLYKQLDKLGATHRTMTMEQGSKQSRFIAWTFN